MKKKFLQSGKIPFIAFALLFLIKYGYYGFRYYPILDDWIQYGGYPLAKPIFSTVLIGFRTITTRPLASLSDPYIWGQLWHHMYIAFFIITMMHLASCWFFYAVFKKNDFTIGNVALIIYGIYPFGTEATYWISASSRIIVGMFFLSMALYFLSKYFEVLSQNMEITFEPLTQSEEITGQSKRVKTPVIKKTGPISASTYLMLFSVVHLISFGYYEPTIALGFFTALFVLFNNRKKIKKLWIYGIPFLNLFLIGAYYLVFSHVGNMSQRGQFIQGDYVKRWIEVINKVKYLWTEPHMQLLWNGMQRGFRVIVDDRNYLWLFLMLLISAVIGYMLYKEPRYDKNFIKIGLGIVLMILPYLPFFVLQEGGRDLRIAFFSLLGLGVLLQGIFDLLAVNNLVRALMSSIVSISVCLMLLVHVSELTDYKLTSEFDRQIGTDIISKLDGTGVLEGTNQMVILNNKRNYAENNTDYFTHIANSTSSDWALTGLIRALREDISLPYVYVARDAMKIAYDPVVMKEFVFIGIENDGTVKKLTRQVVESGSGDSLRKEVQLFDEEGKLFGSIDTTNPERMIFHKAQ